MKFRAEWAHEGLGCNTGVDFSRRALPDSVLSTWDNEGGDCPYRLVYETYDAVRRDFDDPVVPSKWNEDEGLWATMSEEDLIKETLC